MTTATATSPPGHVFRDADGVRLEFIRHYDAPIADVWAALTDSERTARWIGSWTGDPASGVVRFTMDSAEDGAPGGDVRIVECVAPERLVLVMESPTVTGRCRRSSPRPAVRRR